MARLITHTITVLATQVCVLNMLSVAAHWWITAKEPRCRWFGLRWRVGGSLFFSSSLVFFPCFLPLKFPRCFLACFFHHSTEDETGLPQRPRGKECGPVAWVSGYVCMATVSLRISEYRVTTLSFTFYFSDRAISQWGKRSTKYLVCSLIATFIPPFKHSWYVYIFLTRTSWFFSV